MTGTPEHLQFRVKTLLLDSNTPTGKLFRLLLPLIHLVLIQTFYPNSLYFLSGLMVSAGKVIRMDEFNIHVDVDSDSHVTQY